MIVSEKRFIVAACILLFVVAGGVSLVVVVMERQPPRSSGEESASKPTGDLVSLPSPAERSPSGIKTKDWKRPGQQWRVRVKRYPQPLAMSTPVMDYYLKFIDKNPPPPKDFIMVVRVLPMRHVGHRDIARFQFIPGNDVPKYYLDSAQSFKFVLDVDAQTGQAVEFHPERATRERVRSVGEEAYLKTQLWFPVDWMIRNADLEVLPTEKRYTVPSRDERGEPSNFVKSLEPVQVSSHSSGAVAKTEQAVRVELITRYAGEYRLVQVWVPGEPWWRSFHRYYGEHLDLEAVCDGEEQEKP